MLTLITFLPLVGVCALYLIPGPRTWRWVAAITGGAVLLVGILLAARFNWQHGGLQFDERVPWIATLGSSYHLAVDGLSLPLILLTALLIFLALMYAGSQAQFPREYFALYLVMETGLIGLFSTMDLLLFYVFFEVALVPMYFIIGLWGHEKKRLEAALKFFLYTRVGSLAVLLSILGLYLSTNPYTFDLPAIIAAHPLAGASPVAFLVLLGFLVGFGIKLPVFPLHSWLPDAHTEAPTEGSVVLAGLLLKMGGYGLLRLALPTVPDAFQRWAVPIAVLALISAIYGAVVAMAQPDLKRLIAFTSVNHMGYVLLGIAVAASATNMADRAAAATGATYQLVAHGLVTGMLFFLVGMLADRVGTREIARLSGIWAVMPLFGSLLAFAMFASLGLPALAHFVAEVQIVLGTLGSLTWAAFGMLLGILITTAMFLWTLQRVLLGKRLPEWSKLPSLSPRELTVLIPLIILIIVLGILPGPLVTIITTALQSGPVGPLGMLTRGG